MALRVCVHQSERLFRAGLGQLLRAEGDIEMVGTAATGDDLLRLLDEVRPDVAVIDLDAAYWSAARISARLRRRLPRIRVVGVYAALSEAEARMIRRTGIAVVPRRHGIVPILAAVRGSETSRNSVPTLAAHVRREPARVSLTAREVAVLTLVGGGHTSREISHQLQISHKTVENHKQRIFGKLGVQNQAHAVSVAMRTGMITPEQTLQRAMAE